MIERHVTIWARDLREGDDAWREKGSPSSPVSSRFTFVFALSHLGPDYLGAWNRLLKPANVHKHSICQFFMYTPPHSNNSKLKGTRGVGPKATVNIYRLCRWRDWCHTKIYIAKGFPGKEVQPHSRVNLSESLYEKKVHSFSRAKSWQQRLRMRWLSRIDRVDGLGEPKLVQLGGWPSHYYKTSLATSFLTAMTRVRLRLFV